jgi:hypothetical protein
MSGCEPTLSENPYSATRLTGASQFLGAPGPVGIRGKRNDGCRWPSSAVGSTPVVRRSGRLGSWWPGSRWGFGLGWWFGRRWRFGSWWGRGALVEVDGVGLEAFAERVGVVAGVEVQAAGGPGAVGRGRAGSAGRAEGAAEGVGEAQASFVVAFGVADDAEQAEVVGPVVVTTQAEAVPGVGGTAVLPVKDVMDLQAAASVTTRHGAAAVAAFDEPAQPSGHHAGLAADAQRDPGGFEDGPQVDVTQQQGPQRGG